MRVRSANGVLLAIAVGLTLVAPEARAQATLRDQFDALGGYEAYLAHPANVDLLLAGICDDDTAFTHWSDTGRFQGRLFDDGQLRSDLPGEAPDPDYAIDGGFSWEYTGANTVVFITADAPKPAGWDGRELLLERCQQFNLGTGYTAQDYRTINLDVASAIDSGLIPGFASVTDHYVKYGFKEGRLTSTEGWTQADLHAWDDDAYFDANPDVRVFFDGAVSEGWRLFGKAGFAHWINFGRLEARNDGQPPSAEDKAIAILTGFDEAGYLARNPEIAAAVSAGSFDSGEDHFEQFGKFEYQAGNGNRRPNHYFDNDFYLAQNPSVQPLIDAGSYDTAWDHYVAVGAGLGFVALPVALDFDEAYYLATYPELAPQIGLGQSYPIALLHYIDVGQLEDRNPNALFDESYYVSFYALQSSIDAGTVSSGHDHYQRFGRAAGNRTIRAIAGTLTVGASSPNDYATIQRAIDAALDGETVSIPAGSYAEGAFGVFAKSLRIEGAGKGLTILRPDTKTDPAVLGNTGGGIAVVFGAPSVVPNVVITGITFTGGDNRLEAPDYAEGVAGGLTVRGATVELSDCEFLSNKALTGGGLILEDSAGSTVDGCDFRGNVAQRDGGAIAAFVDGVASITNSSFEDNVLETRPFNFVHDGNSGTHQSDGYRAVGVPYSADSAAFDGEFYDRNDTGPFRLSFDSVVGPVFVGFYAGPLGGAIALSASSPLIQGNSFLRNSADFAGGAIYMIDGAAPTIDQNVFEDNTSSRGGAVYAEAGPVTAVITDNDFIGNAAPAISDYPGSGKGGAIALYFASTPRIESSNLFRDNLSAYGGGAIAVYEGASATIDGNSFESNQVSALDMSGNIVGSDGVSLLLEFGIASGGAIEVADADASITGNSFDGNVARLGAGVAVSGMATVTSNSFDGNAVIAGAVGTFPGDTDVVGSGLWMFNFAVAPPLKVSASGNSFASSLPNTPHDIVMNGIDQAQAFQVDEPGEDIFVCIPGVACP